VEQCQCYATGLLDMKVNGEFVKRLYILLMKTEKRIFLMIFLLRYFNSEEKKINSGYTFLIVSGDDLVIRS